MTVKVPPIKSQGIKTKLVPHIARQLPGEIAGRWIEPFLGTGVVAFNLAPSGAVLADINPHLIGFYSAVADGTVTPATVRRHLQEEGHRLATEGERHYYFVRDRFNDVHAPLDFLFVNRSAFNGMIRFNRKGGFNVPFCRKVNRFAPAYVTKIVNQVDWVRRVLAVKKFTLVCQDFEETLAAARAGDFIYCDPPYADRHADFFNAWSDEDERRLAAALKRLDVSFVLSSWHHNAHRKNEYIDELWSRYPIVTREHFYHVGASEANRGSMTEALVCHVRDGG